jgi:antibiotic biosynthesis monooxygenase (ABM) superfamily enzyme
MISKHIRHYLNDEGKIYFTQWLQELKRAKEETPGFEAILLGSEQDDKQATHLILQFKNQSGYQSWSDNPAHEVLLQDLKPYLIRDSEIRLFDFEVVG